MLRYEGGKQGIKPDALRPESFIVLHLDHIHVWPVWVQESLARSNGKVLRSSQARTKASSTAGLDPSQQSVV
jgi:hypothetical protein